MLIACQEVEYPSIISEIQEPRMQLFRRRTVLWDWYSNGQSWVERVVRDQRIRHNWDSNFADTKKK
jgi:hypothetical protein